jgi:hypothetical protein
MASAVVIQALVKTSDHEEPVMSNTPRTTRQAPAPTPPRLSRFDATAAFMQAQDSHSKQPEQRPPESGALPRGAVVDVAAEAALAAGTARGALAGRQGG